MRFVVRSRWPRVRLAARLTEGYFKGSPAARVQETGVELRPLNPAKAGLPLPLPGVSP
jgi:hypothetical protein